VERAGAKALWVKIEGSLQGRCRRETLTGVVCDSSFNMRPWLLFDPSIISVCLVTLLCENGPDFSLPACSCTTWLLSPSSSRATQS
jgi:hypothetical protein